MGAVGDEDKSEEKWELRENNRKEKARSIERLRACSKVNAECARGHGNRSERPRVCGICHGYTRLTEDESEVQQPIWQNRFVTMTITRSEKVLQRERSHAWPYGHE